MTLKELKLYLNEIPATMDDFNVVNGEFGIAKDGKTFIMTNNDVMTVYIDEKTKEIQFLHQTDQDVKDILYGVAE
jgi:tricorn protease-like protein